MVFMMYVIPGLCIVIAGLTRNPVDEIGDSCCLGDGSRIKVRDDTLEG
jgi:hypothetical protein